MKYSVTRFAIAAGLFAAAALLVPAFADDPKPGEKEAMKDKMMKGAGTTGKSLPKLEAETTGSEVVYFSSDGPVRVRFTATIEGKPAEDVWREALDALFAYCDKNGDGVLDAKDRATFNSRGPQYLVSDQEGNVYSPSLPQLKFTEKNRKVDKEAFRAAVRAAGLGPVQVTVKPARSRTAEMTDTLFKLLDTDKDGKLSVAELKAAREHLMPLDVNEDELVSSQELTGRGYGNGVNGVFFAQTFSPAAKPSETNPDFYFPTADPVASAKEIIKQKDKNKDGVLSREEFGCTAAKLPAGLDKDGDGKVTEAELVAWLRAAPDLQFKLEFGNSTEKKSWVSMIVEGLSAMSRTPGEPISGLALVSFGPSSFGANVKKESNGEVTLVLTDARIRFSANRDLKQSLVANWTGQMENAKSQFDSFAGEGKVIDRKKLTEDPNLGSMAGLFDFADRNSDGKIDKKELEAALKALTPLIGCRAEVSVTDQGRGLFELLDTDGDGRLSPRELASAYKLIAMLDRNGDGFLDKSEIPKVIAAAAVPASAQVIQTNLGYFGDFSFTTQMAVPRFKVNGGAPEWFLKMDRNSDGDVSLREFLGPIELFHEIDSDGDGLISAEEAKAFEVKRARK